MSRTRRSVMETQMLAIMIVTGTLVLNVKIFGHYIKAKEETNGLIDVSGKKIGSQWVSFHSLDENHL